MLAQLNPFKYSLAELQKTILVLIAFGAYTVSLFVVVEPGLIVAITALVPAAFTVVGVFLKANHSADQFNKAFVAMLGAAFTVVTYFHISLPVSTENKLLTGAGALATILAVLLKGNAPINAPVTKAARRTA